MILLISGGYENSHGTDNYGKLHLSPRDYIFPGSFSPDPCCTKGGKNRHIVFEFS